MLQDKMFECVKLPGLIHNTVTNPSTSLTNLITGLKPVLLKVRQAYQDTQTISSPDLHLLSSHRAGRGCGPARGRRRRRR